MLLWTNFQWKVKCHPVVRLHICITPKCGGQILPCPSELYEEGNPVGHGWMFAAAQIANFRVLVVVELNNYKNR